MNISATKIAEFRIKTGFPMMECKNALQEAKGDETQALEILRKKGFSKAASKSDRVTKSGIIDSYLHDGKIGVLVEVLSETDFVAKNEDFKKFVHEIALQIASANPKYIGLNDIPAFEIEKKRKEFEEETENIGKTAEIIEKIVDGKIRKWQSEVCLLNQEYIRDENKKISDLLAEIIAKIGENIIISRFARLGLGEEGHD